MTQAEIITHDTVAAGEAPDAVRLSPDVALVMVEDGAQALLDMNGDFYGVSETAALMIRRSVERGRKAAAQEIADRYGADVDRVAADLDGLMRDLEKRGVIRRDEAPRRGRVRRLGAGLFAGTLAAVFRLTRRANARAWAALALSRISFGLFGWSATLDAWRARFPAPRADATNAPLDPAIDAGVRDMAARIWLGVDCKERALSCFALARHAGRPAELNIGIALYPLGGHCWCTSGQAVLGDDPARSGPLIPVFRFT